MPKYTKQLQFDPRTRKLIKDRDRSCIFCQRRYHMTCTSPMLLEIEDIMHYVPRSSLGLGIPQNGVLGCRHHHGLLDNGNQGLRREMLGIMQEYLKRLYPDWDKDKLTYHKYDF